MMMRKAKQEDAEQGSCAEAGCCGVSRRAFIKLGGLAAAASGVGSEALEAIAGPFEPADTADHFVPADKKLKAEWIAKLTDRGDRTWYTGADLKTIGMPVGGLCAGQVYLAGDGRLAHWDIFNLTNFSGFGANNYAVGRPPHFPLKQGFEIRVESGGREVERRLDGEGFPGVRFSGEYPIGTVEYREGGFPVEVTLEAFSPFIPLNEEDSALPATVLQFTIKNTSGGPVKAAIEGLARERRGAGRAAGRPTGGGGRGWQGAEADDF